MHRLASHLHGCAGLRSARLGGACFLEERAVLLLRRPQLRARPRRRRVRLGGGGRHGHSARAGAAAGGARPLRRVRQRAAQQLRRRPLRQRHLKRDGRPRGARVGGQRRVGLAAPAARCGPHRRLVSQLLSRGLALRLAPARRRLRPRGPPLRRRHGGAGQLLRRRSHRRRGGPRRAVRALRLRQRVAVSPRLARLQRALRRVARRRRRCERARRSAAPRGRGRSSEPA